MSQGIDSALNAIVTGAAPIFEIHMPAKMGNVLTKGLGGDAEPVEPIRIYADGRVTGLPEGAVIVNKIRPVLDALRAK